MSLNLFAASNQWSTRPSDERFWTLADMRDSCKNYADNSKDAEVHLDEVKVLPQGADVAIVGRSGVPAVLTNYAFGQLARLSGAPASYLHTLPAPMAADCLNQSMLRIGDRANERRMLLQQNGKLLARCVTSNVYERVWNYEVCDSLLQLGPTWRNPPAWGPRALAYDRQEARIATDADCIPGVSIVKPGDMIAPSGLYASDKDMFAFMVNTNRVIDGSPGGLSVGFFCWNSEVGDSSLGVTTFAFDYVCGNHVVWGAKNVTETRIRHVGDARKRSRTIVNMSRMADASASEFEKKIAWARSYQIAEKPADVIAAVVKAIDVSAAVAKKAYEIAEQNETNYGSPRTVWGMVSGLTQIARDMKQADTRSKLDTAAGGLLDVF